jgi:hypothetical protein
MSKYTIKIGDKCFKQAKAIPITNKQQRKLKSIKKGSDNMPYMKLYKLIMDDLTKLNLCKDDVMLSSKTYSFIGDLNRKWVKKMSPYASGRKLDNECGMINLNYGPTDVSHPKVKDFVIYFIKDRKGKLSE